MEIVYARENLIPSFRLCLDEVAREEIYLEMVQAPPLDDLLKWHLNHARNDWPQYFALDGGRVVGWADVTPAASPRLNHRGSLGMGIARDHRRRGIGKKLLETCIAHSRRIGLEKIELLVNNENAAAIALYRGLGFKEFGLIRRYRKLKNRYFDCLQMDLFI